MVCPECGAAMFFDPEDSVDFCPYCGYEDWYYEEDDEDEPMLF